MEQATTIGLDIAKHVFQVAWNSRRDGAGTTRAFHCASSTLWVIWTRLRELPYRPAAVFPPHQRPDR
jgi:hypothetical protein